MFESYDLFLSNEYLLKSFICFLIAHKNIHGEFILKVYFELESHEVFPFLKKRNQEESVSLKFVPEILLCENDD